SHLSDNHGTAKVTAAMIDRMLDAFDPARGALVVVPTIEGKRGNPVVWSRRFFPDPMTLESDVGARHLIATYADAVAEVPLEDSAALTDVDTPDALQAVKAELEAAVGCLTSLRISLTPAQPRAPAPGRSRGDRATSGPRSPCGRARAAATRAP